MITSKLQSICPIVFPEFVTAQLYMHEFDLERPMLPSGFEAFIPAFLLMVSKSPIKEGKAFCTIDSRHVEQGTTHRRAGPHVDGNYLYNWGGGGGNGWLTGDKGRVLPPEQHTKQYASKTGGTLIASTFAACKAWIGEFNAIPKQGGDCSHIDLDEGTTLNANEVYLMNSTCIHESIALPHSVNRTLLRITLPDTKEVL